MLKLKNIIYYLIIPFLILLTFISPVFPLFQSFFKNGNENWDYIRQYFFTKAILNNVFLIIFVSLVCFFIAFSLAIFMSLYEFPGKNLFQYLLILPFTIPAYIGTYAYYKFFDFASPLNVFIREFFGIYHFFNFDLFSVSGSVFIFSIFFYPYLYMALCIFFQNNIGEIVAAARTLKASFLTILFKILLPLSYPIIIGGLTLIAMEVISDFGVTSYLGIRTFSSEIFKIWFGMNDLESSLKFASYLIPIIFIILSFSYLYKKNPSLNYSSNSTIYLRKLKGLHALFATSVCSIVFCLGYLIPVFIMIRYSFIVKNFGTTSISELFEFTIGTLILAISTAIFLMIISTYMAHTARKRFRPYAGFFAFQYALPGMVVAVLIVFTVFQGEKWKILPAGIFGNLRESYILLIFAYITRFLILGYHCTYNAFRKIGLMYADVAKTLGCSGLKLFIKIELPLILPSLCFGSIIIIIDIIKELPMTLFLRPFNFDTLSTKTYDLVHDEMFAEACPLALILIFLIGIFVFVALKFTKFQKILYTRENL